MEEGRKEEEREREKKKRGEGRGYLEGGVPRGDE